jgi:hypothetical protein
MTYGQPYVGTDSGPSLLREAGLRGMLSSLGWRVEDLPVRWIRCYYSISWILYCRQYCYQHSLFDLASLTHHISIVNVLYGGMFDLIESRL